MIKVLISNRGDQITHITIKGHAFSNVIGKDLVCAGVSSIAVGALNTIEELASHSCELKMDNGFVEIRVIQNSETLQIILKTLLIQLKTIEFNYQKYIKIKKQEV